MSDNKANLLQFISDLCDKAEAFDQQIQRSDKVSVSKDTKSPVPMNLVTLTELIREAGDNLHQGICKLEQKLSPILPDPDPSVLGANGVAPALVPVPLGGNLEDLLCCLHAASNRIARLTEIAALP
jgi:hypothetical protein